MADAMTSTAFICLDDEWHPLNRNLQISSDNFPVRNLLLNFVPNGMLLSWDPPALPDNKILGYAVTCTTNSTVSVTISLTVNNSDRFAMLPSLSLPASIPTSYRCCVTTQIPGPLGARFVTENCSTVVATATATAAATSSISTTTNTDATNATTSDEFANETCPSQNTPISSESSPLSGLNYALITVTIVLSFLSVLLLVMLFFKKRLDNVPSAPNFTEKRLVAIYRERGVERGVVGV